ncbi:hypothetical protein GCM10007304_11460 [Rhodococcoides trifolii]|uniref:PLD phosphodiesterase domain-containing protein n=1 Tax=Rhodococcoides trifolii TaxID=908250 RepID=A0A917CWP6_9NOCA|nr:phospholipase D family protein [Rhodococcus trifolii]GGF99316.1 hypothetical protein GCM10007304_11460 [Rhodococcus trifolii]
MLPPDSRTTLLKRLQPPAGYFVSQVVGTTFTLDLDSAMLPSLALSRSAAADSADRLETIAAVQASIGEINIFHQSGLIKVPPNRSRLHTLMEPALHAVRPSGSFVFHPKIWLARYENFDTADVKLRLIVLSRNLTRDRSWDVALTLDGQIESTRRPQNKPLVDFLRYLPTTVTPTLSADRGANIDALAEEVHRTLWEPPPGSKDLTFHIFGVPKIPRPKIDFSGYKHLLVSPFLTDDGFETIADDAKGSLTVVSRQEALDGLSKENADWIDDAYVLSPTAGIPADEEESTGGPVLSGLHAKLYCVERAKLAHLFIGSANATRNGLGGNVEILVELTGSVSAFGVDTFLGKDGFTSILQPTTIEQAGAKDEDTQVALDGFLRRIASLPMRSELSQSDETYRLHLTSDDSIPATPGVSLTVSLLTDKSTTTSVPSGASVDVTFGGLALSDVTAFVVLTASNNDGQSSSAVFKCELINDIPARMHSIITREINSPDAFRRFLSLLLAFGAPAESDGDPEDGGSDGHAGRWDALESGLFEQLLRAASHSPETLDQLSGVVTSIIENDDPHGVLPEGFRDLWIAIATASIMEAKANV